MRERLLVHQPEDPWPEDPWEVRERLFRELPRRFRDSRRLEALAEGSKAEDASEAFP